MVRIGILVKHRGLALEECDFLPCSELEWTKEVPHKYFSEHIPGKRQTFGQYGIQADVAIGAYIQNALKPKNMFVDLILPEEVTKARLKKNDLNFLLGYGVTEAHYHIKSSDKAALNHLKSCLLEAENLYPPRNYQELIYSKINYYNYFKEKEVAILPTFTMAAEEYHKLGHDVAMKKMLEFWKHEDLGTVIAKPVLGMAAADVEFFNATDEGRSELSRYFRKCMKKYPGLIVQKSVKGFGMSKECPELRMYFLGDEYKYSVSANANCVISHPAAEGGTLEAPLGKLKVKTHEILKKLPPIVMPNGARVPRLITRLDMGWRVDGKYQPFVNEIELTPSLYLYRPLKGELVDYIACCAKQMLQITKRYIKGGRASGKSSSAGSRRVLKPHFLKHRLNPAK